MRSRDAASEGGGRTAPALVVSEHSASYPDPIQLRRGEAPRLTGREEMLDGWRWLWAVAPDGRAGWIPDDLLGPDGSALEGYSAVELSVGTGDRLAAGPMRHGWRWCRNAEGGEGWVPASALKLESDD